VPFPYTIIRRATDRMLMIEGSAGTERDAGEVVKRCLDRFQEQLKRNL